LNASCGTSRFRRGRVQARDAGRPTRASGDDDDQSIRSTLERFGEPRAIAAQLRRVYRRDIAMNRLVRLALSAPVAAAGLLLISVILAGFVGISGWMISSIPPGPTSWHDADFGPFATIALSVPLLVLYGGSLGRWWLRRERPYPLVVLVAGLNLALLFLALGSTR